MGTILMEYMEGQAQSQLEGVIANDHYALGRYDERMAIMAYLRSGGDTVRGTFYAWDSEMRGYYASVADKIAIGDI